MLHNGGLRGIFYRWFCGIWVRVVSGIAAFLFSSSVAARADLADKYDISYLELVPVSNGQAIYQPSVPGSVGFKPRVGHDFSANWYFQASPGSPAYYWIRNRASGDSLCVSDPAGSVSLSNWRTDLPGALWSVEEEGAWLRLRNGLYQSYYLSIKEGSSILGSAIGDPLDTKQRFTATPLPIGGTQEWTSYDENNVSPLPSPAHVATSTNFDPSNIASEAQKRACIVLNGFGTFARWNLISPANVLTLRYSVQDGQSGTLTLRHLRAGAALQTIKVPVTSFQAWVYLDAAGAEYNVAAAGRMAAKRFNEARVTLASPAQIGDELEFSRASGDALVWLDVLETEWAPPASSNPGGNFISVTGASYGAVGDGVADCTLAFKNCISAAASQGKGVFIPAGRYVLREELILPPGMSLVGAGWWHTELRFTESTGQTKGGIKGNGSGIRLANLYLTGSQIQRSGGYHGLKGWWGSGSLIENVWVEQTGTGGWIADYNSTPRVTTGLVIRNCRFRNTFADGVNFAEGTRDSIVDNCHVRGNGDDGLATWASGKNRGMGPAARNVFRYNTVECVYRAGGIGVFGGESHVIHHNYVRDQLAGEGIRFNTVFRYVNNVEIGYPFGDGTPIRVYSNQLERTGTTNIFGEDSAALDLQIKDYDVRNIRFEDIQINGTKNAGVRFTYLGSDPSYSFSSVELTRITFQNVQTAIKASAAARGSAAVSSISIPQATAFFENSSVDFGLSVADAPPAAIRFEAVGDTQLLRCTPGGNGVAYVERSTDLINWSNWRGPFLDKAILEPEVDLPRVFYRLRDTLPLGPSRRLEAGAGGAVLELPAGQSGPTQNPYDPAGLSLAPSVPRITPDFSGPVPTCSWWSSLIWDFGTSRSYGYPLYAWPLAYVASGTGLGVGQPTVRAISTYEYHYEFVYGSGGELPLRIGPAGLTSADLRVADYGDWTVKLRWQKDAVTMDAVLGMGLPMAWFRAGGAQIQVTPASGAGLVVWRRDGRELGLRLFGVNYLLTAPTGSGWSATSPYRPDLAGEISVALLPDTSDSTLARFRGRASPADSRVTWSYNESTARLNTKYELVMADGATPPPMALFPHQWTRCDRTATDAYDSPRGRMRLVDGGWFETVTPFDGLLPEIPAPVDDAQFNRAALIALLVQSAADTIPVGADTYWAGKALGRIAGLIPIARQVGRNDLADTWVARLRASLEDWFDGRSPNVFRYDAVWTSLYGFPAGYETNRFLQDHHFHWGYFLQAAAQVAREDPQWAQRYGPAVELLIRDTANWDRGDATFPFLNSFEIYAGHAWANGPSAFFAGNNQESSSESLNFAAGVFQWGLATGRRDIRDLGIFLYATEVDATHLYWLNEDGLAFPPGFNWPVLGMVWGNGGAYSTWFGSNPAYIHGINFLPITPASLHLGRRADHLLSTLAPFETSTATWFDIITAARATADPAGAAARLAANPGYTGEGGLSRAQLYHWVHSLRQYGRLSPDGVSANLPSAVVMGTAPRRTYVAWNPDYTSRLVRFSDGRTLTVPPRSLSAQATP